tara:strand:- start:1539 stop:2663 length:1125 start_codon:yes stop_codon:yes gene_type:complete
MSLQEINILIKNYFIDCGFNYVELPLVYDADIFYETSGEVIRKEMFSFFDDSGKEKCLRPDLTVPTCQSFINQTSNDSAKLCYSGPIFRSSDNLEGQSVELNQSGVEMIFSAKNLNNKFDKDVEVLKLATSTLNKLNIFDYRINIGSLIFFHTFLYYLELPDRWKQRLLRHFFRRSYFETLLERISSGVGYDDQKRKYIMKEKFGSDDFEDQNLIELLYEKESIGLGSRSVEEIAERFSQKSENIVSQSDGEMIVKLIRGFLKLNGKLEEFPEILRKFVKDSKITFFDEAIQIMEEFVNAVSSQINNLDIYFNNDFGHSIEFYDGIMFEIFDKTGEHKLISGGRYDQLLKSLGSKKELSAIGFATNNNEIEKII